MKLKTETGEMLVLDEDSKVWKGEESDSDTSITQSEADELLEKGDLEMVADSTEITEADSLNPNVKDGKEAPENKTTTLKKKKEKVAGSGEVEVHEDDDDDEDEDKKKDDEADGDEADEDEDDEYDNDPMNKIPTAVIDRLGQNAARNKNTFNKLKEWADKGRQILFFGANLTQAVTMSKFLQDKEITSETIIGETPYGARRTFIKRFKDKDIQVLCNYEVLATGFDSPEIDTLMIARPTSSKIVYEQMVGRGLRGTAFGGTEDCTIITVKDNIYRFGGDRIDLGYDKYRKDLEGED